MSRLIAVVVIFVLTAGFIGYHSYEIITLKNDVEQICDNVYNGFEEENWDRVEKGMEELNNRWDESRFWASLTIDTEQIEQIEISMKQSQEYIKLKDAQDFAGEFVMLKMLIDHLPHQEGLSVEEFF